MNRDKLDEILIYLDGMTSSEVGCFKTSDNELLASDIRFNIKGETFDNTSAIEIAIIGIKEEHHSCPQLIREELYRLARISSNLNIADLGNIKLGKNQNETFFVLQEVIASLFHQNINVIVIGGSQVNTIGCFRAFSDIENDVNLVCIDPKFDIKPLADSPDENNFLEYLMTNDSSNLYNVATIGYQSYFVGQKQIANYTENYFSHVRLGEVRENMEELEPIFRDADLVSFDMSAIRIQDAPAQINGSPNGIYAEEACRLSRYAGISDRTRLFGFFNYISSIDEKKISAKLASHIVWYYIEGYRNRKHDYPSPGFDDYTKYVVAIDEIEEPIVFYKSNKTGRWWINVNNMKTDANQQTSVIVSCLEKDYLKACKNEIPECWWTNFKKLR